MVCSSPKILIIGYQRSGTTLLRRMINAHPSVHAMFHETWLLNRDKPKVLLTSEPVGEKIVYTGKNRKAVIEYVMRWRSKFGPENSKVLHIVRHPLDCALSNVKLKWMKNVNLALQNYYNAVPKMMGKPKGFIVQYETLALAPVRVLKSVFEYCGLSGDREIINSILKAGFKNLEVFGMSPKLDQSRVFVYRTKNRIKELNALGTTAGTNAIREVNKFFSNSEYETYSWPHYYS